MEFHFGAQSEFNLRGVHPDLVKVVRLALGRTSQDFGVTDGVRTRAEQEHLVAIKASKTMHSRHLIQHDGTGHAVDLVPYERGRVRWEWPLIYPIAVAMAGAARTCGVQLVWGGVWDRRMSDYATASAEDCERAVKQYQARHPGPDFLDGPHYELAGS